MTNQHPIVPSPEQVDQWFEEAVRLNITPKYYIATQAAQWGADQELEACVEWLGDAPVVWNNNKAIHPGSFLRTARRPKPPSLKAQALQAAQRFYANGHEDCNDEEVKDDFDIIRRALESLPD